MVSSAEHKKIAADLYRRLDIAVKALENATSEKSEEKAEARIATLEERIAEMGKAPEQKPKPKEDDTVCPECGADLRYVQEGVVVCEQCGEYYEYEEEEE